MIELPGLPIEKYERSALRAIAMLLGLRLGLWLSGQAASARSWRSFVDSAGVYVTALALFAGAFWLGLLIVHHFSSREAEAPAVLVSAYREPAEWTPILDGIPHIASLPREDRQRLGLRLKRFLERVRIEGCNGLEVNAQVRLAIAAEACLLALNLPTSCYGQLKTVLVYPSTFVPRQFAWGGRSEGDAATPALGESWAHGTVILAWDDVVRGIESPTDGSNVVFHEFAHQLDSSGGQANGVPPLGSSHRYAVWTRMLERNFLRFAREVRDQRPSVLNPYGATDHAEFFAVATEAFFERPHELRHQYPELFDALKRYYKQNPSLRVSGDSTDDDQGPAAA